MLVIILVDPAVFFEICVYGDRTVIKRIHHLQHKQSRNGRNYISVLFIHGNDKDKNDASYITSISAAQYDRVPEDIAENRWENLLTTEKKRINMNAGLNAGVRGYDADDLNQHLIDTRIFVFVHRNDNYVKPEAVITGGYFTETTVFGDVVLNKKK